MTKKRRCSVGTHSRATVRNRTDFERPPCRPFLVIPLCCGLDGLLLKQWVCRLWDAGEFGVRSQIEIWTYDFEKFFSRVDRPFHRFTELVTRKEVRCRNILENKDLRVVSSAW